MQQLDRTAQTDQHGSAAARRTSSVDPLVIHYRDAVTPCTGSTKSDPPSWQGAETGKKWPFFLRKRALQRQIALAVAKGLPIGKRPSHWQTAFPAANRPRGGKPGLALANRPRTSKPPPHQQTGARAGKPPPYQQTALAVANRPCTSKPSPHQQTAPALANRGSRWQTGLGAANRPRTSKRALQWCGLPPKPPGQNSDKKPPKNRPPIMQNTMATC